MPFFVIAPTNISVLPEDSIEILLSRLYSNYGISDYTDFKQLRPEDYPTLSDLYDLIEAEYKSFDESEHKLYTAPLLQEVLLGLNSICKGADSKFFNGHTNITSHRFLVFGVKSMLMAGKNVQNAMLFNILSFMSDMRSMRCRSTPRPSLRVRRFMRRIMFSLSRTPQAET